MGCSPPVVVHACASSPVKKGIVRTRKCVLFAVYNHTQDASCTAAGSRNSFGFGSECSCWYIVLAATAGLRVNKLAWMPSAAHRIRELPAVVCFVLRIVLRACNAASLCDVTLSIGSVVCWRFFCDIVNV